MSRVRSVAGPRGEGHAYLANLRVPFAEHVDSLSELPLTSLAVSALEKGGLLEPHELSTLNAVEFMQYPRIGTRRLLEVLAVLECAGARPVPSNAPLDFPGKTHYPIGMCWRSSVASSRA